MITNGEKHKHYETTWKNKKIKLYGLLFLTIEKITLRNMGRIRGKKTSSIAF